MSIAESMAQTATSPISMPNFKDTCCQKVNGLSFNESLERAVNVLVLLGLAAFGIGLLSWVLGILHRYGVSWQGQSIAIGLILILLATMVAKLFSKG